MKRSSGYCAAIAGSLLLFTGCGKDGETRPAAGHELPSPLVAQCEPGHPGGRLTLAVLGVPVTFNPILASGASDAATRLLFGTLLNMDAATQEVGPGLAESWSVEPDQKTWTFKLRSGLRWSDGEPLTADDVAFTWNEVMYDPLMNPTTYSVFLAGGKPFSVTNLDELTVRVTTAEPFAPLLEYFCGVPILPRHMFAPAVQARQFLTAYNVGSRPDKIVGSGPFRVKEVKSDRSVLLERNPEYWMTDKRGQRLPYFDEVLLVPCEPGGPRELFLAGKCDAYEQARPEEFESFKKAAASGRFRIEDLGAGVNVDFIFFNQNTGADASGKQLVGPTKLKWFRNKTFRQAVSCAIDRDRIVREDYDGRAQPAYSFVSSQNAKWINTDVPRFAYDPARARSLLVQIGLEDRNGDGMVEDTNGAPVEFTFLTNTNNPPREREAALIVEDLKKAGLKADLQFVEFAELVERANEGFNYDCILMGLGGGASDPASHINVLKSDEPMHQWFPNQRTPSTQWEARVDVLMDAQMRTLDFKVRKKMFDEVQAILAEEQPMISTVSPFYFAAVRTDIGNVRPSVSNPYHITWNVQELYFRK